MLFISKATGERSEVGALHKKHACRPAGSCGTFWSNQNQPVPQVKTAFCVILPKRAGKRTLLSRQVKCSGRSIIVKE